MRSSTRSSVPAGYEVKDAGTLWGYQDDESAKGLWLVFGIGLALVVLAVALVFDSVWGAAMVFLSLAAGAGRRRGRVLGS